MSATKTDPLLFAITYARNNPSSIHVVHCGRVIVHKMGLSRYVLYTGQNFTQSVTCDTKLRMSLVLENLSNNNNVWSDKYIILM